MILVGGDATRAEGWPRRSAWRRRCGARVICETFPTRLERGAGLPAVERLAYFAEAATAQLEGAAHIVLAGAPHPVSFFAYPGKPSDLVPEGAQVHKLAGPVGAVSALSDLADRLAPGEVAATAEASRPALPSGPLTVQTSADVIGALLPERAVVVDESNTSGFLLPQATAGAPAHDWLTLTGGAIGYALPVSVGAAIAAPGPAGAVPGVRRLGDVHHLGLVDAGTRASRHHHRRLRQPGLRHLADRTAACRRADRVGGRRSGPQGAVAT